MTAPTLTVLLLATAGVFWLPRRWVPVPFLVLACYIPKTQVIDLGPLTFTVLRAVTVAALFRILIRGDWKGVLPRTPDYLMCLWAMLMVGTVAFHRDPSTQGIERLGLAFDGLGLYLMFRVFCQSQEDITFVCVALGVLLVPLAASMVYEKISSHNLLSFLGSPEAPQIRDSRVRAQGPFRHAILAGTIGALSLPFMVALWPTRRVVAAFGLTACLCIVASSTSSGPLMSLAVALFSLSLWPLRQRIYMLAWGGVALYLLLAAVMNRPPYYLIGEIDLTGGSTGWHRARLIESSLEHLDEWWLAGTDFTRHWMATGVSWSPDHADLTNHYVALGVYGGLPLLVSFLALMAVSFNHVGRHLVSPSPFLPWTMGCALFTIAVTSVSISYFDQSILWLYMTIACCSALAGEPAVFLNQARLSAHAVVARHRARRRLRARTPSADTDAIMQPSRSPVS